MRHLVFGAKLNRDINARKALLINLADSLFKKGSIVTTEARAKFVRPYAEKLISTASQNKLSQNRRIASVLTREAFAKLINEIAPGFSSRPGGYTRIIKLKMRRGDAAPIVKIELLEFEKPQGKAAAAEVGKKVKTKSAKDKPAAKSRRPAKKDKH